MIEKKYDNLLGFKEFCTEIKDLMAERFSKEYKVELNQVLKNNSIILEGIVILQKEETIAPNIYLNNYYVRYQNGLSLDEIVESICKEYNKSKMKGNTKAIKDNLEFEKIKNTIVYRLINFDKNKSLLSEIPHTKFLDLAVTFHCLVKSDEEGIGTIRVTNEHLKVWNVSLEDLIQYAKINTPILFPPVVQSMKKVIDKLLMGEFQDEDVDTQQSNENFRNIMDQEEGSEDDCYYNLEDNMLVISNQRNINGASCMIYDNLLSDISEQLNADLYILPSSIHELIVIKNENTYENTVLKDMVKDVNLTQVPLEDILSNNIYFYSRNRQAITCL
ncbi:MAG: DUF5688 family protein [Anaerocolumna sp.]